MLLAAPLYHAMPNAWYSMSFPFGCTYVLMSKFDTIGALSAIDQFKVNGFYMPPILLKRLLQISAMEKAKYDRSSVKVIMSSGAACPTSVKQGIADMFGP